MSIFVLLRTQNNDDGAQNDIIKRCILNYRHNSKEIRDATKAVKKSATQTNGKQQSGNLHDLFMPQCMLVNYFSVQCKSHNTILFLVGGWKGGFGPGDVKKFVIRFGFSSPRTKQYIALYPDVAVSLVTEHHSIAIFHKHCTECSSVLKVFGWRLN